MCYHLGVKNLLSYLETELVLAEAVSNHFFYLIQIVSCSYCSSVEVALPSTSISDELYVVSFEKRIQILNNFSVFSY